MSLKVLDDARNARGSERDWDTVISICRHMRGYKEAPAHVRWCVSCDDWKKSQGIKNNFWCKHDKFYKTEWDQGQGWD